MINVTELRKIIEREFASNIRPSHGEIAREQHQYPDYEGNEVSAFLEGKRWQEITFDMLKHNSLVDMSACLNFLQPEGFRYFLPAFLIMALDFEVAGEISDAVCTALTRPEGEGQACKEEQISFASRVMGLREGQKATIKLTLEFLSAKYKQAGFPDDPAENALRSYWARGG